MKLLFILISNLSIQMGPQAGCGFAYVAAEQRKVHEGCRCEISRSTSNSRAKRVTSKTDHKKWYEKEEIASQYLHCVKDPPCQSCCRYNERLFKKLLETKRKFPPYIHKVTDFAHLRPRIHGRRDEDPKKIDINLSSLYHGLQGSDVTAFTRPVLPPHPAHPDANDAPTPWFGREFSAGTKVSEAATLRPRLRSRDYFYGVQATDVTSTTRRLPTTVVPLDEAEEGREFYGRPKTHVTDFNVFPQRIQEGVSRMDAARPIGRSVAGACRDYVPLARDSSGRLLSPINNLSSFKSASQSQSPSKVHARSTGETSWNDGEEKELLCRRSPPCKPCANIGRISESDQQLMPDATVIEKSSDTPTFEPSSLPMLSSRVQEARISPQLSSHLIRRSPFTSCDDRLLLARDSAGRLLEPPPVRSPSSAAKPSRPPSRAHSSSPIPPPSNPPFRPRRRKVQRLPVCKHPPCKPCNLSCFDQHYSSKRGLEFKNSADKQCTLPDIFNRESNSTAEHPRNRSPFSTAPPKHHLNSPLRSQYAQTSYGRLSDNPYSKARWKDAVESAIFNHTYRRRSNLHGKAKWRDIVDRNSFPNFSVRSHDRGVAGSGPLDVKRHRVIRSSVA